MGLPNDQKHVHVPDCSLGNQSPRTKTGSEREVVLLLDLEQMGNRTHQRTNSVHTVWLWGRSLSDNQREKFNRIKHEGLC